MNKLYIIIFFFLIACKANKFIGQVSITKYQPDDKINYTIKKAYIENNNIIVHLEYQGSKDDTFQLLFNGNYLKSHPPIAKIYLKQEIKKQAQNKKLNKILTYNLSKLKYPGTNETIIHLHSFNKPLTYNYLNQ